MKGITYIIRPGEDGRLYTCLYRKEPFYWMRLDEGTWGEHGRP